MTDEQLARMRFLRARNRKFAAQVVRDTAQKARRARRATDSRERAHWLDAKRIVEARNGELTLVELETLFAVLETEAMHAEVGQDPDEARRCITLAMQVQELAEQQAERERERARQDGAAAGVPPRTAAVRR